MTLMRRVPILTLAIGALVTASVAWTTSSASSATAPTLSLTIAGTDMHSLDPHLEPMFVNGGGVVGVFESGVNVNLYYLETGFQLPVGAKVTSVQVTAEPCSTLYAPQAVFGSYQPTTGNTVQSAGFNFAKSCTRQTLTKTGNPITTVVAGRRYAIDFLPVAVAAYPGDPSQNNVFFGATVKYTCTSPCVP